MEGSVDDETSGAQLLVMERPPRSVGVRARTRASMSQYHTLRSFVISLVIAIAITASTVRGFTILRPESVRNTAKDLETGASTQLKVKYDLKKLSNTEQFVANNNEELDTTVIAINNTQNVIRKKYNDEKNYIIKFTTPPPIVSEISKSQTLEANNNLVDTLDNISKLMSMKTSSLLHTTAASSTYETITRGPETTIIRGLELKTIIGLEPTTRGHDSTISGGLESTTRRSELKTTVSVESTTTREPLQTLTRDTIITTGFDSTTTRGSDSTIIRLPESTIRENQNLFATQSATATNSQNFTNEFNLKNELTLGSKNLTKKYNSIDKQHMHIKELTDSITNRSNDQSTETTMLESYASHKDVVRSIFETDNIFMNDANSTSVTNTDEFLEFTTVFEPATDSDLDTDMTTKIISNIPLTEQDVTTATLNTETITADIDTHPLPPWKTYTTIDRKRISTEDTTVLDKDMTRAETGQTHLSVENILSYTPIPSLEKLRNDFINAQESTTVELETTDMAQTNISSAPDMDINTSTQMTALVDETVTAKLDLVSKRAGYIDNTETTTPKMVEATTSVFPSKVSENDSDSVVSSMYETEAGDVDVPDTVNVTGVESQSQLVEDAIKEELLREETLNDNEENAQRHRDERVAVKKVKLMNEAKKTDDGREVVTEDMLSVKPISHEKRINSALYAVSPNYKPLKKLDVQPPKQFIRDPDDNSWRNESISSLGIVFKPKNASKSFTQVLKNKTEIELSNIEAEKDNKGDVPDLRLRLEKIAEVRKTKKKKVSKFGDTVYSDYEESSENMNRSNEDVTSPMIPSMEVVMNPSTTSPPAHTPTMEFDLTVNAISKDKNDMFKTERTTPLTTDKPKKFYNLAEYYDTTDEYDADYVHLPKIDLKKFTQPFKIKTTTATDLPDLLFTKPMVEYQSERKATVQYFPPTQKVKQKVRLNDYDNDFNKKLNLYTLKVLPKNMLTVSYGTVSPVQTEKYYQEPLDKITEKPSFTPMYKTENMDKNLYLTNRPAVTAEPTSGFLLNDGNFNRASYVIKHYRDFINEAAKESEDERNADYLPYTESPIRGVTISELAKMAAKDNPAEDDYDYDLKFRKDVLNRFVDNFNQNSERFKVDFPILYNNSVVHRNTPENGKVASSSASVKRLYDIGQPRFFSHFLTETKPCDPHCDNMTVELSPAYELHYYVPDQEEKEEIEPRPIPQRRRFRL